MSAVPAVPAATTSPAIAFADAKTVRANELGDVPFLMYHRIVAEPGSVYDRSPAQFRAELERLAAEDYVPVTAKEAATGRMDIPAGKHPVVLTFDDGDPSQFGLDAAGKPIAGTAVDLLLQVGVQHPGFRPVASFYVNANPFGGQGGSEPLEWLRANGFEVGNHTYSHANLAEAGDDLVQREIADGDQAIVRALPGYRVSSLALPFGAAPSNPDLARTGASSGISYEYDCVLLVGAGPSPSPYSAAFDPLNVPRIRSQDATGEDARYGSTTWLDELAAHPDRRYTSDGVPDRISYPLSTSVVLAEEFEGRAFGY
ncbi:polysaccharide deacetylase family protein [Umezawaea sp. Da 62-37]|uniref:polysaccharide deacetylase family protein n=1 Tax=Umezawaea sp. Da 62-37 TaxID=3075927 RepID=UPI0028F6E91A|nr:polysaccharide deacetylase family protein [Umezawaea sp. Da 62-37]WNV83934.1 polysaccharide deacetylase family protein [Umezawaea sp. Da 62-37]